MSPGFVVGEDDVMGRMEGGWWDERVETSEQKEVKRGEEVVIRGGDVMQEAGREKRVWRLQCRSSSALCLQHRPTGAGTETPF